MEEINERAIIDAYIGGYITKEVLDYSLLAGAINISNYLKALNEKS